MNRHRFGLIALAAGVLFPGVASAQVRFERTGYRLTSIGEKLRVSAQAPSAIRWHIADPEVASVSNQGVVEAKQSGYTRLWAVAGEDSASALILVDQWVARFDFSPSLVRLLAIGSKLPVRIQARDAQGNLIPARTRNPGACRSLDTRIATLASNGQVTAVDNGVTYIRCTDRGIADSVRVEVRQKAATATIIDKLGFTNRVAGDTFRIRIAAKDVSGGDIRNVQATWASLQPAIVSIDPQTGMARAALPGNARIVAQIDDATDTVNVQVIGQAGLAPVVQQQADTAPTDPFSLTAPRTPTLNLASLFLTVGDTARVTPRDASGLPISNAEFRMTSNDTSTVRTLSGQRVVARGVGSTYVIVQFGIVRDSLHVSVREKASDGAVAVEAAAVSRPFVRPTFNRDSARVASRARLDSARREIQRQSVVAVYNGRMLGLSAVVVHAAHATRDTNFHDKRTGMLYGGIAELAPHKRVRLSAALRSGQLSPTGASGEELTISEIEGDVTVLPAPWIGLRAGYVRRSTRTPLASQRWEFPKASAVTRFDFVGGALTSVAGLSLLPGATYTGHLDAGGRRINPDPFSLAGEAGLELHSGRFMASLMYYAERFTFPAVNNNVVSRTDQFSALRFRAGFQLGR